MFAVLSQLPYSLSHTKGRILNITEMNMMFTLLLCFFLLCVLEYVKIKEWKYSLIFLFVMISLFSDWALLAPVLRFFLHGQERTEQGRRLHLQQPPVYLAALTFLEELEDFRWLRMSPIHLEVWQE